MFMGVFLWGMSALVVFEALKSFLPTKEWTDIYGLIEKFTLALCLFCFIVTIDIKIPAVLKDWWENRLEHLHILFKYFVIYASSLALVMGVLTLMYFLLERTGKINSSLLMDLANDADPNDRMRQLKLILEYSIPRFSLSLFTLCFLAPVIEETFFRRFLFVALRKKMDFIPALLISVICFMVVHPNIALGAIGGIYLGYVYEKGKSLPANILIHSTVNLTVITISMLLT